MVLWADRIMALPFLTVLAPSKRFYANKPRAPKTLLDWARQVVLQIHRWLPNRSIVLVADSAFAAIEFLAAVRNHVCVVTRLRLDANLFAFPPPKRKGRRHGALVSRRCDPGADPLAPRPRSLRAARTSGLLGDRSQRPSPRHPRLVRQPLASRGRISGDTSASRGGNSAPVVRQGDPAHHTGFARSALNCNALGT